MNRSNLILGLITVFLALYVYVGVFNRPDAMELRKQQRQLSMLNQQDVQRIEIVRSDKNLIFNRTGEDAWLIESPITYPADEKEIQSLLIDFEYAQRLNTLPDSGEVSLESLGLKNPATQLKLITPQVQELIQFGKKTPTPGAVYARIVRNESAALVVVRDSLLDTVQRDLNQWRKRNVFNFPQDEISSLVVRKNQLEIEVESDEENNWAFTKPMLTGADSAKVAELLERLNNLEIHEFVSDGEIGPTEYGLSLPTLTLTLHGGQQPLVLKFGKTVVAAPGIVEEQQEPATTQPTTPLPQPDVQQELEEGPINYVYAKRGRDDVIFTLEQDIMHTLDQLVRELRNRQLVSYQYTAHVRELEIKTQDQTLRITRDALNRETFHFQDQPYGADFLLIDRYLGELFASRVVAYPTNLQELQNTSGLDQPSITLTIKHISDQALTQHMLAQSSPPAPNTAAPSTTTNVEQEPLPPPYKTDVLEFGYLIGEEGIYARSTQQPGTIIVDKKLAIQLPEQPWQWYDKDILQIRPTSISKMEWRSGSQLSTLVKEKGDNGQDLWTWQNGQNAEPVDMEHLGKQILILSNLQAQEWIGPPSPRDFIEPSVSLTIYWGAVRDVIEFGTLRGNSMVTRLNDDPIAFLIPEETFLHLWQKPSQTSASPR